MSSLSTLRLSFGLISGVGVWGDRFQLCFDAVAHLQCVDKLGYASCIDGAVGACQRFKRFIGLFVAFAAKYGLNGFSHYAPHFVEVGINGFFV